MILKDPSERKMPHSTFYYPLQGGIQTLVNAIAEGTDVKTSYKLEKIEKNGGSWIINGEDKFDRIVSTIPLPALPAIMDLPESINEAAASLKFNSLTTVLFDCEETDISWLYIPSHKYRSHRVVYQSALVPNATPEKGRGSGAIELIGPRFDVDDRLLSSGNIIPEELGFRRIIDSEFTEYAYVIHDMAYRRSTTMIREYFAEEPGFDLLGRWGTWNYKNMDICIFDAMKTAESIGEA